MTDPVPARRAPSQVAVEEGKTDLPRARGRSREQPDRDGARKPL